MARRSYRVHSQGVWYEFDTCLPSLTRSLTHSHHIATSISDVSEEYFSPRKNAESLLYDLYRIRGRKHLMPMMQFISEILAKYDSESITPIPYDVQRNQLMETYTFMNGFVLTVTCKLLRNSSPTTSRMAHCCSLPASLHASRTASSSSHRLPTFLACT